MKLAVLSDIHGNMFALNAVLDDMKKYSPDRILCLGDLAMAGPEPNKTIDFVKTQDWTVIQGNTDEMIAYFSQDVFDKVYASAPIMANALNSDVQEITSENKKYLKNLPINKCFEIDGIKVLMVHGSPRKNNENIYPNMSMEIIEDMFCEVDADLVFCGHTHIPCGYQTNSKITVVNDGSVGRPFTDDTKACYVIADINDGKIFVEHHFVDYDKSQAMEILKNRNFEGAEKLAQMLINPKTRHM
ncbi:metallophosphoesterase family protein [bacterium]|nr:metallophosphoesterase family protein [bacterium]